MTTFLLRWIIAHWIADLDIAHLKTAIDTILRAGERRARERRIADREALTVFDCGRDDHGGG